MRSRRLQSDLREVLQQAVEAASGDDPVAGLVALVDALRPGSPDEAEPRALAMCDRLEVGTPEIREQLGALIRTLVRETNAIHLLTESGIPDDDGFWRGVWTRLGRRVLPEVEDTSDLRTIVHRIFHRGDDHV